MSKANASPLIDRRHLDFLLYELLDVERLTRYPRFAEHNRETFDAAIELAHQIAVEKFLSHNRKSDLNEPQMVDGKVVLIPEIADALDAYNDSGFAAALADFEAGGMQLPFVVATVCDSMFSAANPGTVAYPALARAAANLLEVYGTDEQKRLYMQPIVAGRYYGTMCLSEPQAGSSLADIRTLAEPRDDGSYRIRGAKMWISAGDHELGENIVHLVLARIAGAPAGVRASASSSCRAGASTTAARARHVTTCAWPGSTTRWGNAAASTLSSSSARSTTATVTWWDRQTRALRRCST